jgi:hypothetical protein
MEFAVRLIPSSRQMRCASLFAEAGKTEGSKATNAPTIRTLPSAMAACSGYWSWQRSCASVFVASWLRRKPLRMPCTSTPAGKAMFQMCGVFPEFERAMILARVNAGLERAKASGKVIWRPRIDARARQTLGPPWRRAITAF